MDFIVVEKIYKNKYRCLFSYGYYLKMVIKGLKLITNNVNVSRDFVDQKAMSFANEYNIELFTTNETALLNNSFIS